jgi:hypothetical protein
MMSRSNILALHIGLVVAIGTFPAHAAQKDLSRTETFSATDGKTLLVDGADLDIRVRSGDIDQIEADVLLHIRGAGDEKASRWIENHTPAFTDGDDQLRIDVTPGKAGFLGLGWVSSRARIAFLVPSGIVPDVTTTSGAIRVRGDFPNAHPLRLRTSAGNMEMAGAARSLDIRTAEGDAQIEVFRPLERLFARSSSGDVRLVGGSRDVHVDTASGNIWLENLSGNAEVITSTGKITLSWDRMEPGRVVRIRSSSGKVHLMVPEGVHPQGTLTTTTGSIRSELPGEVSQSGVSLRMLGDGPTFDVETASADIQLTIRESWD